MPASVVRKVCEGDFWTNGSRLFEVIAVLDEGTAICEDVRNPLVTEEYELDWILSELRFVKARDKDG